MDSFIKAHLDSLTQGEMVEFCEESFTCYASRGGYCVGHIPKLGYVVRHGFAGDILFKSCIPQEALDKYKEICISKKKEHL